MELLPELWAAPAAVGFAMFFNVRKRALVPVGVLAVVAHTIANAIEDSGGSLVTGSFVGAFVIGVVAYTLGPWSGEAAPVYAFAPVIPLVPGFFIFNALKGVMEWLSAGALVADAGDVWATVGANALSAAAITLALALGATSPMLLLPRTRTPED